MAETQDPVVIAGAGPTGMMAALELSRFGIPVRLVEKRTEPATTSRAIGVQARTLELFEQRGIQATLVGRGNHARAAAAYGGGKQLFRLDFAGLDSTYNYLLFVSQAETEQVLRDALEHAGVAIEWGVVMDAFGQAEHADAVTAVLRKPDGAVEEVRCAYLVSAEGAHSTARHTLDLPFEGKALEEQYALGDFHADTELPEHDFQVFSSEHGFLGLFPMGDHRYRLIASNPISTPSPDTEPSLAELQALFDQRSPVPARFHDLSWSSWFHINSRMIHRMSVGRVFVGGDSAHIHSPAGAQGMNTGMQDMVNLGWKMAMVLRGVAKPGLLETYGAERVPVIENVLTKTEGLTAAIGNENAVFRTIFNHVAPWIVGTDLVQASSTERMSQLGLDYRGSPLSTADGHTGSLRAGDRLPDLDVQLLPREGEPRAARLFGLLDPSKFTLLYSNIGDPAAMHGTMAEAIGGWAGVVQAHQVGPAEDAIRFEALFGTKPGIRAGAAGRLLRVHRHRPLGKGAGGLSRLLAHGAGRCLMWPRPDFALSRAVGEIGGGVADPAGLEGDADRDHGPVDGGEPGRALLRPLQRGAVLVQHETADLATGEVAAHRRPGKGRAAGGLKRLGAGRAGVERGEAPAVEGDGAAITAAGQRDAAHQGGAGAERVDGVGLALGGHELTLGLVGRDQLANHRLTFGVVDLGGPGLTAEGAGAEEALGGRAAADEAAFDGGALAAAHEQVQGAEGAELERESVAFGPELEACVDTGDRHAGGVGLVVGVGRVRRCGEEQQDQDASDHARRWARRGRGAT